MGFKMKIVTSIEHQPYLYRDNPTWYDAGTEFEVVEEKELKLVGLCYKLKIHGFVLDGWNVAKDFKEVTK